LLVNLQKLTKFCLPKHN